MVLYEMLWMVSRHAKFPEIKSLVQKTAATVVGRGGVVKRIQNQGHNELAYDFMTKGERHKSVRQLTLEVECSPATLKEVSSQVRLEPLVLRSFALRQDVKMVPKQRRFKKQPTDEFAEFEALVTPNVPKEQWQTIPLRQAVEGTESM